MRDQGRRDTLLLSKVLQLDEKTCVLTPCSRFPLLVSFKDPVSLEMALEEPVLPNDWAKTAVLFCGAAILGMWKVALTTGLCVYTSCSTRYCVQLNQETLLTLGILQSATKPRHGTNGTQKLMEFSLFQDVPTWWLVKKINQLIISSNNLMQLLILKKGINWPHCWIQKMLEGKGANMDIRYFLKTSLQPSTVTDMLRYGDCWKQIT